MLGAAGATIGGFIGGPVGASIGWAIGAAAGNALFPMQQPVQRLHDLHLQGGSYGTPIKIIYGTARIAGSVVWETDLQEHISGGKGKGGPETASYTASFRVVWCEKANGRTRLWAGGRLNYDINQPGGADIPWTFYDGRASQLPDPTEEAVEGVGNVPAYRGVVSDVFADWDMGQFGNALPQLSAELYSNAGGIPWRVSSFTMRQSLPGSPDNMCLTFDPLTNNVTFGTYYFAGTTKYATYEYSQDGTEISSTIPTAPDDFLGAPVGVSCVISNLQCALLWSNPGTGGRAIWYVGLSSAGTEVLSNPAGGSNPDQAASGVGAYQNGHIYAAAENGAIVAVASWAAPDGVPTGLTEGVPFPVSAWATGAADVRIGTGDNGKVYVWSANGVGSPHGPVMWELNEDLTVSYFWDIGKIPLTFGSAGNFCIYNGMLCFGDYHTVPTGGHKVYAYTMNADRTFTEVGNIPQVWPPLVRFSRGLVAAPDGIFSLDPPPAAVTLASVVADLCGRAGLDSSEYDVSELEEIFVDGYVIEQQMSVRQAIETLMPVYFFDAVESDGVVKFVVRGGKSIVTFPDDDLAAAHDGQQLPAILECVHTQDRDLPSGLTIAYMNKDADYQINTQPAQRMVGGNRAVTTVSVPVVLSDSHAKSIVDSWLFNAWWERDSYTWYSSRKYAKYEPTDVVTVQGKILRITKKTEGATGVIKWEGVPSRGANFVQAGAGGAAHPPDQVLPVPQAAKLILLDIPLLADTDSTNGIYAGMAGALSAPWSGSLFKSIDGTTYNRIAVGLRANTMGTGTALGNFLGESGIWDETNVLRVTIGAGGGTLSSATALAVINGANEGVYGAEILQWKNATLVSAGVYDLTGLLRGRRGTEWAIETHIIGETFVSFDPAPLNPAAPFAEIGSTAYYKGVTSGRSLTTATAQTFANVGNALKPYSPSYLAGGCDASGNVTGTFQRRTRIGGGGRLSGPKPLSEATESYMVQIWDASYTLCARHIPVTTQTFSYSSADQVTDFGAQQQTIFWTVGQIGAVSIGAQARGTAKGAGGSNGSPLIPIVPYSFNPIITPPPPPSGRAVNHVFTWPSDQVIVNPFLVGTTWVGQFTTGGSVPLTGTIGIAEYQSASNMRHCFIATDSDGLNKVARSESYGTTATSFLGTITGGAILAPATTYYWITDFIMSDGTLSSVPGTNSAGVIALGNIT